CTGVDACESCVESHCDSQAQACYGSGYKSGNFSGPCAPFITCVSQCNCGDTTCQSGCFGKLTNDCQSCGMTFSNCEMSSGCARPTCTGGTTTPDAPAAPHADAPPGGGGAPDASASGGTECSMLAACCPKLPAQEQPACNQVVGAGNEQACQLTLQTFGAACH